MSEKQESRGETVKETEESRVEESVRIDNPQLLGDAEPFLVGWGKFEGPVEKIFGGIYFEISPEIDHFKSFNLGLFDEPEKLDNFSVPDKPILFQQAFDNLPEVSGELSQTDHKQATESVKNFVWDSDNQQKLWEAVEEYNEEELYDWWYRLFSTVVLKGKLKFQAANQLITQKALSRSMKGALSDKHRRSEGESEEEDGEEESHHFLSVVTVPFNGVSPEELQTGDLIFVRAVGAISNHFPEEMQSDRYDFATVPIEAKTLGVKKAPELPPSYEGIPENYYEITARFGENEVGEGYVYKDEKVKPAFEIEEEESFEFDYTLIPFFIGVGLICITLAISAYWIFG